MNNEDKAEKLLDMLLNLIHTTPPGLADGIATAYQLAGELACELEEAKSRAAAPEPTPRLPFAWATFDGEGSYDLRLYECNESYHDDWIAANGQSYANWVIPLYEAYHHATMNMEKGQRA